MFNNFILEHQILFKILDYIIYIYKIIIFNFI